MLFLAVNQLVITDAKHTAECYKHNPQAKMYTAEKCINRVKEMYTLTCIACTLNPVFNTNITLNCASHPVMHSATNNPRLPLCIMPIEIIHGTQWKYAE